MKNSPSHVSNGDLRRRVRSIGMLSTFPPQLCGIATFGAALTRALVAAGVRVEVMQLCAPADRSDDPVVVGVLDATDARSVIDACEELSTNDVVVIQHEFGIYGGADGEQVLDIMALLTKPTMVVVHTVVVRPTPHQLSVLYRVCEMADEIVTMTATARDRLVLLYGVNPAKIRVIAHGATLPPTSGAHRPARSLDCTAPQLLTWGLLGPGKGIEHAIEALSLVSKAIRSPRYTVAGVTHPNVVRRDGQRYRNSLIAQANALGVADRVIFDEQYRAVPELMQFVQSASAVVLPYDSTEQVTSGVLVDAIAAGRPVISTAFPHAVELLGVGAGIVVPQGDVHALADAIQAVVTDEQLRLSMERHARRIAPSLSWSAVAAQYLRACSRLVAIEVAVTR